MKKYLIVMAIIIALVGCGEKDSDIGTIERIPPEDRYLPQPIQTFTDSDIDSTGETGTGRTFFDYGDPDFIVRDSELVDDDSLATDWQIGATSFTFSLLGREVTIDLEDFKSMTAQEVRDFNILLNIMVAAYTAQPAIYIDPELVEIWGMKLLPRFFKPKEAEILTGGKTLFFGW